MRDIKTFIASSTVEFRDERVRLGNFIRSLDSRFTGYGYHFQAVLCEDLSPAMERAGSQSVIDGKIRESQFFYMLIGQNLGEYTEGEFDTALTEYTRRNAPRIYTYFRVAENTVPSDTVARFKRRLKRLGHYRSEFRELSELERDITIEMMEYAVQNAPLGLFFQNALRGRRGQTYGPGSGGYQTGQTPEARREQLLALMRGHRAQAMEIVSSVEEDEETEVEWHDQG